MFVPGTFVHQSLLLGSKTISLEEFKIQYSVCFVWFAKLQPYKFESVNHRFDITMEHYSNIQHRLNIHMKQVAFKYLYLKVFWSRRLFCWNIIEDISLLQEKKNYNNLFHKKKKCNTIFQFWTENLQPPRHQWDTFEIKKNTYIFDF